MNAIEERVYYEFLCKKYPNVNAQEGEDLNIESNKRKIFVKAWYDRNTYPNLNTLSKKLGIGLRTITSMAKSYNLPHRDKLIMYVYAPNQESPQVRTEV